MKISILFTLLIVSTTLFAANNEKVITAKISAVTMFTSGAEISHAAKITLEEGETILKVTGIAKTIDDKSIRVGVGNDVKINSISYEKNFTADKLLLDKVTMLQDTIANCELKETELKLSLTSLDDERELMIKNSSIGGQNNGVTSQELERVANLFRNRLRDINSQKIKLSLELQQVSKKTELLKKQLEEYDLKENQPEYNILISLNSPAPTSSVIEIKFMVEDAGWNPYYDIRAVDVNNPITLEYKANVYNNCGIDWNNIKLTLSTANPKLTSQKPRLDPWNLNFKSTDDKEGQLNPQGVKETNRSSKKTDEIVLKEQASVINVSELSIEFEIKTNYTLLSNNKINMVDIQSAEIQADYTYFAVPKMDKDAFLIASITGWEELNLIEGTANIYFGGTYIGQSFINTQFASDTLDISLGRDKKIAITRIKKEDYASKKSLSSDNKESFYYETTIRNNNKTSITIVIEDQIPVSQEQDIKVNTIETSGAIPETQTGILTYEFKLQPLESKVIKLAYSVQYPKNRHVSLRKSRAGMRSVRYF